MARAYPETMSLSRPDPSVVRLRPAVAADAAILMHWDKAPHVLACLTDDPDHHEAADWDEELAAQSDVFRYFIAEVDGRPIGAMLDIDPAGEPNGYWGEIEPNLRALDIWIGEADALNRGHGTQMMTLALDACFARPQVEAVVIDPLNSNTEAHRFYQRLGFRPEGRRVFNGTDDCLVHRLTRADWAARRAAA
ncbi:GNAT family N-acetyltransferase [Brevundimonas olei]